MDDRISRVAVIGTGQMGPTIAVVITLAGCATTLIGRTEESIVRGRAAFDAALDFMVEHEAVTTDEARVARAHLTTARNVQAAGPFDLVIESIIEDLAVKQQLFKQLDEFLPPETIISSNTSALRITDIAALMKRPERAVTTHFWNPAHLMPLVEVIQGEKTTEDTIQRTYHFLKRCGKRPVIGRKDVPGQLCNRLQQAVIREAIYMVQSGIASVEDVETCIKAGMGIRLPVYGPLEHLDAIGLDLGIAVQATVLPSLCNATEPLPLLKDLVAAGHLGAKTGQGFYDWQKRSVAQLKLERDLFLIERMKATKKKEETEPQH